MLAPAVRLATTLAVLLVIRIQAQAIDGPFCATLKVCVLENMEECDRSARSDCPPCMYNTLASTLPMCRQGTRNRQTGEYECSNVPLLNCFQAPFEALTALEPASDPVAFEASTSTATSLTIVVLLVQFISIAIGVALAFFKSIFSSGDHHDVDNTVYNGSPTLVQTPRYSLASEWFSYSSASMDTSIMENSDI